MEINSHAVMKAEKAHNLPSVSRRTRRDGIIQFKSKGLRTRNAFDN